MYKNPFCRGNSCSTPRFCKINIICIRIFMHMNVDKPQNLYRMRNLQFQPSTTCIKMLPLQNQEPVLAHPCRHLGCQKNGLTDLYRMRNLPQNLGVFSTKSGHPTPCFLVHSYDFQKHWPLTELGTWHEQTFKQNCYLEERKPSKIQRSIL